MLTSNVFSSTSTRNRRRLGTRAPFAATNRFRPTSR